MITVVIPTYNRGDILRQTVPRYLVHPCVSSLIVVDDGSSDNTAKVIESLRRDDPRIRHLRNDGNLGSVVSRNRALQAVRTAYFLMTDDDTYPDREFFPTLLATLKSCDADIIAVRKVRLNEEYDECTARQLGGHSSPVDYDRLSFDFDTDHAGYTTTVPGTFLARQAVAAEVGYDTRYRGSAWREETDFGLSAYLNGFAIYFEPAAVVFELPKTDHRGGQWNRPLITYIASAIRNNWYFLKKFQDALKREGLLHVPVWRLQGRFIIARMKTVSIVVAKRLLGPRVIMLGRRLTGRGA